MKDGKAKIAFIIIAGMAALLFIGCGNELPDDKANYAGEWRTRGRLLRISPEGRVHYYKGSSKLKAPLQKWKGDDFQVGLLFMNTTFKVSKPPYQDGGTWKMVVDGKTYKRVKGPDEVTDLD